MSPSESPGTFLRDLEASPEEAFAAVETAADAWAAEWQPEPGGTSGELRLDVAAGLRRGTTHGRVSIEALEPPGPESPEPKSRIRYVVSESEYHLYRPAVGILALSAIGALMVTLGPFLPGDAVSSTLLIPVGALLAVSGWFLVNARLRAEDPGDFLREVEAQLDDPPEAGAPAASPSG